MTPNQHAQANDRTDQKHTRNIKYEGEFLETHRRYVLEGLAAAVLPDFVVAEEYRQKKILRLKGPRLHREIFLLKRKNRPLHKSVDIFRHSVIQAIKALS